MQNAKSDVPLSRLQARHPMFRRGLHCFDWTMLMRGHSETEAGMLGVWEQERSAAGRSRSVLEDPRTSGHSLGQPGGVTH